ncbi:radical SAM protein [Nonomuraea sp. MG754425]|uniref:radical SAM protein n=1 Tax=Nonomuraea sp. MG754425 TaxID=2570319 RepID=UPI001F204CF3|nr:radical SAM protein [Nonomuraea sp. MG754425]MCF6469528.1 radical SAM protein [Nonomuraea sp. MG754425]
MTVAPVRPTAPALAPEPVWFLELELTNRCQLGCMHCYAGSGPAEGSGEMTRADWERLLATAPDAGIRVVQFIGGEATLHPDFPHLAERALGAGLKVQVYSNLYRVTNALWELYSRPDVTLATSYYSDLPAEHDRITGRKGSHSRTRAAVIEAVNRGIPLKVGIVDCGAPGQRAREAREEMIALGVAQVPAPDRIRGVGRAAQAMGIEANVHELCGRCGSGRAAVSWDGDVRPCVLSRFLPSAGNVRTTALAHILGGAAWNALLVQVPRRREPDEECRPDSDGNDCRPAETVCEGDALVLPELPARCDRPGGGG